MKESDQIGKLVRLSMSLEGVPVDYNINMSSNFHGVLMEAIDEEYAEQLHQQGLKPYAQYLNIEEQIPMWHICTLSEQAYQKIICPLLRETFTEFELKHNKKLIKITNKKIKELSVDNLFSDFYNKTSSSVFKL